MPLLMSLIVLRLYPPKCIKKTASRAFILPQDFPSTACPSRQAVISKFSHLSCIAALLQIQLSKSCSFHPANLYLRPFLPSRSNVDEHPHLLLLWRCPTSGLVLLRTCSDILNFPAKLAQYSSRQHKLNCEHIAPVLPPYLLRYDQIELAKFGILTTALVLLTCLPPVLLENENYLALLLNAFSQREKEERNKNRFEINCRM